MSVVRHGAAYSRREFLRFMGRSGCSIVALGQFPCASLWAASMPDGLPARSTDELELLPGLRYRLVLGWGDRINSAGARFGFNNDYTAVLPIAGGNGDLLLWTNHEYLGVSYPGPVARSRADVQRQMRELGGSTVRIRPRHREWQRVYDDPLNGRIDALSRIPFSGGHEVLGQAQAIGTFGNCAGGVTPWRTVLSCEENYDFYFGEVDYGRNGKRRLLHGGESGWGRYYPHPPEHYGWVVEVDPWRFQARKLVGLGRFAHEGATVVQARDRRCVVYMGDDAPDRCIYKFIAAEAISLEAGTLYAADTVRGRWLPLDVRVDRRLAQRFDTQLALLISTRAAAALAGATPQDRPEGIAVDPATAAVYVSLTKGRSYPSGAILKLEEKDADPLATEFQSSVFLAGGREAGFACPDNLVFDPNGNLWIASDISSRRIGRSRYAGLGNNALFCIPLSGPGQGLPIRVASAPHGAELTGPSFAPDGRTLFLSVQHPGEGRIPSHWPGGGASTPRPCVVAIQGEFLDRHAAAGA